MYAVKKSQPNSAPLLKTICKLPPITLYRRDTGEVKAEFEDKCVTTSKRHRSHKEDYLVSDYSSFLYWLI